MCVNKLKKLSEEAFLLLTNRIAFAGFVRACLVLGLAVYTTDDKNGVVVKSNRFSVTRFRDSDGFVISTVSESLL